MRYLFSRWELRLPLLLVLKKDKAVLCTAYGEVHVAGNCGWLLRTSSQHPLRSQGPKADKLCQEAEEDLRQISSQLRL